MGHLRVSENFQVPVFSSWERCSWFTSWRKRVVWMCGTSTVSSTLHAYK
jgi:hypothetical protein